jgi:hypothetical protein
MTLNSTWTNGEEAEAQTDEYFFAPWSCLKESELAELSSLASQLRDGLKKGG